MVRMESAVLADICRSHERLYTTPELNTRLFLQHRSFESIENLEKFTNLKALYLHSNQIKELSGVESLTNLRQLHLKQNLLTSMSGADQLPLLTLLDLSFNQIQKVTDLSGLPCLDTLLLRGNRLSSLNAVAPLQSCASLQRLDLSNNLLIDTGVVDVLQSMPMMTVLWIKGNPFLDHLKPYRKILIARLHTLTMLDDAIVELSHRVCAEAFVRGGRPAEARAMERLRQERRERERRSRAALQRTLGIGAARVDASHGGDVAYIAGQDTVRLEPVASAALATRTWSASDAWLDCAVCTQGYDAQHPGTQLACGHVFHVACIGQWLRLNDSCPMCRAPYVSASLTTISRPTTAQPTLPTHITTPHRPPPVPSDAVETARAASVPQAHTHPTASMSVSAADVAPQDTAPSLDTLCVTSTVPPSTSPSATSRSISSTPCTVSSADHSVAVSVAWTPQLSSQLALATRRYAFDFGKVASWLGRWTPGVTATQCRARWVEWDAAQVEWDDAMWDATSSTLDSN